MSGSDFTAFIQNHFFRKMGMFSFGSVKVASPLLRLCGYFLPHHLMEIAIKLEPGMLHESAWAHLNRRDPRNRMHYIIVLWYKGLRSYEKPRV